MKLGKTLGAIVCASALAMATAVPAFAATAPTVSGTSSLNSGTGSTEVSGFATNSQIVATVPMTASVFMPLNSGAFIAVPSPSVYCIDNKGNVNIKCVGIDGTAVNETLFKLVAGAETGTVAENQVYMTIQTVDASGVATGNACNVMTGATGAFNATSDAFVIPANDQVGLRIGGGINTKEALSEANTYKLVNVKYTVQAA